MFQISNNIHEKTNLLLMLLLGDIVRFSEEGRFDVFDRKKEIMKYNGYQVHNRMSSERSEKIKGS